MTAPDCVAATDIMPLWMVVAAIAGLVAAFAVVYLPRRITGGDDEDSGSRW